MARISITLLIPLFSYFNAQARDLKVATWNLGWHLSQVEANEWIAKCGAPFQNNVASESWEPAESGMPGWELKWGRDAKIAWDISALPPCDVYRDTAFKTVPVTEPSRRRPWRMQS